MDGKNGCANKTIPRIYFERHRWVVGALKHAKGQNLGKIKVKNTEDFNIKFGIKSALNAIMLPGPLLQLLSH